MLLWSYNFKALSTSLCRSDYPSCIPASNDCLTCIRCWVNTPKKKKRIRLALLDLSSYFLINWRARVCVIRTTQIKFRMFLRCRAYLSHIHSICVFTKRYIFWENCAKRCLITYALCILCKMRRTHFLRWTEKFRWNFLGIDLISFRLSDSSAHMCLHSFRVSCFPYLIWLISRAF